MALIRPIPSSSSTPLTLLTELTGVIDGATTRTYDCTSIPNYHNLTSDNFIFLTKSAKCRIVPSSGAQSSFTTIGTVSYDSNTGICSVVTAFSSHPDPTGNYYQVALKGDLYLLN